MKITRAQLKKIIIEEVLKESVRLQDSERLLGMMDVLADGLSGADGEPNGWKALAEEMALAMDDQGLESILSSIAQAWGVDMDEPSSARVDSNAPPSIEPSVREARGYGNETEPEPYK